MKKSDLNKISNLIIFNKKAIAELDTKITKNSLDYNVKRWIADGTIIPLKRGLYMTKTNYEKYKNDNKFTIYLANSILFPSYVTADTILREYDILSEGTFGITSFTLKGTKLYSNKVNTFRYSKVKPLLYSGYVTDYFLDKKIYYASKAKALIDFLYVKSNLIPDSIKNINLVEDLRLNLDVFEEKDFVELKNYRNLIPRTKMYKILNNVINYAPNIKFIKPN